MTVEASGERFVPEAMGGQLIEAEHVARYALAAQLAGGRRVLDAGCGVGWGTAVLVAAGASSATGVDLDADAIANSRLRVADAHFEVGDLAQLPWDAESFDLVVCFETLEHVREQDQALDELTRMLAPDGLLLVSSPNPRVYPAGNPFHRHELTPEELEAAVHKRLANVALWKQHTQIASIVVREGDLPPGESCEVLARTVAPLASGSDPYSLVIAARGPLPSLRPLVACAPQDQLLHLEALAALLSDERERMADQERRVVEERGQILAERGKLLTDLAEQTETIRALGERVSDYERVLEEREQILAERDRLTLETREQAARIAELEQRIMSLERQTQYLRRERERAGALLLESEQQLAEALVAGARDAEQAAAALAERAALRREIEVFRTSKSWRFTAPLRRTKRLLTVKR
jgi:SAM-dependent methyltransferase